MASAKCAPARYTTLAYSRQADLVESTPHSCLPTPTATSSTHYTLSAAAQLPTASTAAQDSFVSRNGSRLVLAGHDFKAVGPNIYWLGPFVLGSRELL